MDIEILQFFLAEASDYLLGWEGVCIELEKDPSEKNMKELFRMAHNLKGAAKSVGLVEFGNFVHQVEDVITLIQKGEAKLSTELITQFLNVQQLMSRWVEGLKDNPEFSLEYAGAVSLIKQAASSESQMEAPQPKPEKADSHFTSSKLENRWESEEQEDSPLLGAQNVKEPASTMQTKKVEGKGDSGQLLSIKPQASNAQAQANKKPLVEDEPIKISLSQVDKLLNLIGELVVNKSIMTQHRIQESLGSDHAIQTLSYMEKLIGEIQDLSFSLRMLSVKPLFQRMRRIVRDLGQEQKKDIHFQAVGEDVEVDKTILDRITDPLIHIIRNAVDHGIEGPDERILSGKGASATVTLSFKKQEDHFVVLLKDDGRGLNKEKILKKAIEKNIIDAKQVLTDEQIFQLIFESGFSTKEQITDVSGRGVGMDVVKTAVNEMKGQIQIQSVEGQGTSFLIKLPLSLSVISGMVVDIQSKKYIVPIGQLVETIDFRGIELQTSTGVGKMFNLRGEVIPVYSLAKIFSEKRMIKMEKETQRSQGLIAVCKGKKVAFEVDEIMGLQYVVLKRLGREMQEMSGIIGGTILGDGEPGLILNLNEFVTSGEKSYAA